MSHDIYFHIESPEGKIPLLRYFQASAFFEIIRESFLWFQATKVSYSPLLLVQIGIFFHPWMLDSKYSFDFFYRLVPFNKPKFRRGDSREFPSAPFRSFVYTRGGIESDLVVKKDLTSRGNLRVTIITSKCGGTPKKRFYHA